LLVGPGGKGSSAVTAIRMWRASSRGACLVLHDRGEIDLVQLNGQAPGFDAGEVEEDLDERDHAFSLAPQTVGPRRLSTGVLSLDELLGEGCQFKRSLW